VFNPTQKRESEGEGGIREMKRRQEDVDGEPTKISNEGTPGDANVSKPKVIDESSAAAGSSSGTQVVTAARQTKETPSKYRRSTLANGERKPNYCFSCKQALQPIDFDPGLETCRICLAKRRAKDREKKRLRAMQLKHHLLSADEKEVAAFLLGVYHPVVLPNRPPDNPRQMHVQASLNVRTFVKEFKEILQGKSREQADSVVNTFLGRKPTLKSRQNKETDLSAKKVDATQLMTKSWDSIDVEKELGAADSLFAADIDAVYKRYTSVLSKSMDQTWVRFASPDEDDAGTAEIGAPVKWTGSVHAQVDHEESLRSSVAANEALAALHVDNDWHSSIMNGADPMASQFLFEFLFSTPEEGYTDLPYSSIEDDDDPTLVVKETACDNCLYDYNTIDECQQDGSAYVFKGSLVMGWVGGTSGSEKKSMLAADNGILPEELQPQALSRDGVLYDARIPGALNLLKESEGLHGFAEDLDCYPVINSLSSDIRITLPLNSFSQELGVRALHNGMYVECEIEFHEKTMDIILYPNGIHSKSLNRGSGVIILGVVHLQCFVRKGTAKQLPIGANLPILMLPNDAVITEIRSGIEQLLKFRTRQEARQFLVSVGFALQNGDTKSTKFSFVTELAYILKLEKTLQTLEVVASLAKNPSPISSDDVSEASKVNNKVLEATTVQIMANIRQNVCSVYRPVMCVAVGLFNLFHPDPAFENTKWDTIYSSVILMGAAIVSFALSRRRLYEFDVAIFTAMFAFSQSGLLHASDSFDADRLDSQIVVYFYAVVTTYLLTLVHAAHSLPGILAANVISILMFTLIGFSPSILRAVIVSHMPQDMNVPSVAVHVHGVVTHFFVSSLGPVLLTVLFRKIIMLR